MVLDAIVIGYHLSPFITACCMGFGGAVVEKVSSVFTFANCHLYVNLPILCFCLI